MNTIIRSAITAVVLVAGYSAGQAQAHTVWRYPYKGAPYAVPHEHTQRFTTERKGLKQQAVQKDRRSPLMSDQKLVVAHHKPGYHDGLPRTSPPATPQPKQSQKSKAEVTQPTDVAIV